MNKIWIPVIAVFFGCNQQSTKTENVEKSLRPLVNLPTGNGANLPYLVSSKEGLLLSWVEKKDTLTEFKSSKLKSGDWTSPELIAAGSDWFVNWADYPMISQDAEGNALAHYLAKSSSGTYSYDVNLVRRSKNQWSNSLIPHNDKTPTEHGFVTMLPLGNSEFQVSWLDGRNTGGGGHESEHTVDGAMTLRTAVVDIDGNIRESAELDGRVCDCCQTGGALTKNGPVIVYRDRSDLEIRDISIVRKLKNGWSTPVSISSDNWEISGCPVNGPRADALDDNLVIAWYSSPKGASVVNVLFSENSGENFGPTIKIDDSTPLGRVDVIMIDQHRAMVSWLDKEGEKAVIKARFVSKDGTMEKPMVISETNESRGSGFPQMAFHNGSVYFAWVNYDENNGTNVLMAKL